MENPSDLGATRRTNRLVRPYVVTGGRTKPTGEVIELDSTIRATDLPPEDDGRSSPETHRIVAICRRPTALAEVAARAALPVGVVRVLVGDLLIAGVLDVQRGAPVDAPTDPRLLKKLLHGIRAL